MNHIKEIAKWQKERHLDKRQYDWSIEVANILEELLEAKGYSIPKEKRLEFLYRTSDELEKIGKEFSSINKEPTSEEIVDAHCDIIVFCVGSIMKLGYDPECALEETIKEISSRTGSIVDGKFQKDTSEEAKKKWHKANYERCKNVKARTKENG